MAVQITPNPVLDQILDQARQLPCWHGPVNPQPLSGGLSNHNYTVEDGGRKYVVRIGGDAPMHNVMRFNEHACGRAAEAIGITPGQVYTGADVLVMDFIDGKTFDAGDVQANLVRIVSTVKTLHTAGMRALRGPVLGFSVFHVLRHYAKLLDGSACRSAAQLPRLLKIADALEAVVGPSEVALCHNDLLAANFIDDGEKIWLIDWEHAGLGMPLFDLASIASNNALDETLERSLLECYYGTPPDALLWRRFKALRVASHQRETMWSMVSEIHSGLDEDYAAYTDKNLEDFNEAYAGFKIL